MRLGEIAQGTGEIPSLARIDDGKGQASLLHGQSDAPLIAPRRLQDNERYRVLLEHRGQGLMTLHIIREGLDGLASAQGDDPT
jgi:hypothetical protein